ncbi:outer membrane beta-barrel protein [Phaeodactylibacter sp.]|uniref:outer membrane beta-barrel protein n=1 Tax=Phaeodactylibacter sp. TaxID=1940289 RepID=UPI0025E4BF6E|nr:outer membrane beta-barrel protein [Phaeodactylibacter sp.]MCI4651334.1 PorT family protein [Phaeodactylibacter sp.]MCI5094043.1 PorT family protein [Phaeodactylibacter sp.]
MRPVTFLPVVCILFFSFSGTAQSRFSFGLELFPHASWEQDPVIDDFGPRFSKHAGMQVGYQLGQNFRLQSGLAYTEIGRRFKFDGDDLRWGNQHDGQGGFNPDIPAPNIGTVTQNTVHRFVEVPFRLTYLSPGEQVRFYLSGGIAPRIHIQSVNRSRHELPDNGGVERDSAPISLVDFDRLQFSILGSAGVEMNLSGTTFFAGPRIQFQQLTGESESLTGPNAFELGYMQLGLEFGVRFY